MFVTLVIAAAASGAWQSPPATWTRVPATPAIEVVGSLPSNDKLVCKTERLVGSMRKQRVCKSREKWSEDQQAAGEAMQELANRGHRGEGAGASDAGGGGPTRN